MAMNDPYAGIIAFLNEQKVEYSLMEHEPVYTSEQAARVRGARLDQGAKSLLLKAKTEFVLAVMPGSKRADSKKIKTHFAVKDLRFANEEEVKQQMGCEVGACYPFGNLIGLRTAVDKDLIRNEVITFNPGAHTITISLACKDYLRVAQPDIADITQ